MLTEPIAKLVYASLSRDVVVLSWPDQVDERERLDRLGLPHLWLVEPGADPPVAESCLEDWVRLPAGDLDVRSRLLSLTQRAVHHPSRPSVDEHGQLSHHGAVVLVSPLEQQLVAPLIANFGNAVSEDELIHAAWDEGGNGQTLRVHMSRLRHRLEPVGLTVTSIRGYGYVMRPAT
jgi:Transcriptional regulatory protein, C terminal